MLLKTRLKAGILLYALFITAAFTLILQFYLIRLQDQILLRQAQKSHLEAQLMAELTRQLATEELGTIYFQRGQANYRLRDELLTVSVFLDQGGDYQFEFYKPQALVDDRKEAEEDVTELDQLAEEVETGIELDEEELEAVEVIDEEVIETSLNEV